MREPSVLDYLKSLIDPRRERIQITSFFEDADEEIENLKSTVKSESVGQAKISTELQTRVELDKNLYEGFPGSEVSLEFTQTGQITASKELRDEVEHKQIADLRAWPWYVTGALTFALFAQLSYEPPVRELNRGLGVYLVSALILIWGTLRGEWRISSLPSVQKKADSFVINRSSLSAGILLAMISFVIFGGNRFSAFNVITWGFAIVFFFRAFWIPGFHYRNGLRKIADFLRKREISFAVSTQMLFVVGSVILVLFFRLYQLDQVPPEMFSDHAEKLQDVQELLNGETRIFFPRNTGREAVQMYLTAAVVKVFGTDLTFISLKIGTALAGIFTLPFIYLLGKEIGNSRIGLLAVVMAGFAYWPNVITRVALRFSLLPLFAAPTLYFMVRGLRRGTRNDFLWAGLFLGLGLHGYSPFRIVPFVVAIGIGLYLWHEKSKRIRMQALLHFGVMTIISFIVFLPLARFVLDSPENRFIFSYRTLTRISDAEHQLPGSSSEIFLKNLGNALTMFAWDNGETWVHSVTHRPALDVVSAAMFYMGVLLIFIRYLRKRRWEDIYLLLLVPLLMLPSVLSLAFPNENPSLNRTAGAIVPVFIIIAYVLDSLVYTFGERLGRYWGKRIGWIVVGILVFWSSLNNYDLVFNKYFQQFQTSSWNTTELGAVIRGFADSIGSEETAWVIPYPHWVDTRLVGINAGVPIFDYALPRERIQETLQIQGPKLFLLNTQDVESLEKLEEVYPSGVLSEYPSRVPTKEFWMYLVVQNENA
jgi:4-amino-4-deoxy-L-arabinose transferase-like glycosyltransferase